MSSDGANEAAAFGGLSAAVRRAITRLGGVVPTDFVPSEWQASTPAGQRQMPPWAQAFFAVEWAGGSLRTDDEFDRQVGFYDHEVDDGLLTAQRAWFGIGYNDGQYYYVVDLDDDNGADPWVYRADHEGDEDDPSGGPLSTLLNELKLVAPPSADDSFPRACAAGDLAAVTTMLADAPNLGAPNLGALDTSGITPLHLAVMARSAELVTALLAAGADAAVEADISAPWRYLDGDRYFGGEIPAGATPLHAALDQEFPLRQYDKTPVAPIVRLLLAAGADPSAANSREECPLHLACQDRVGTSSFPEGTEVVRLLLVAGADPNMCSGRGSSTPLSIAARGHNAVHTEVVRLLLDAGADPDVRTPRGVTPLLMSIAAKFHVSVVEQLVTAGADVNAGIDDPSALREGLTAHSPLGIARELGRPDVAAYLESRGAVE